MPETVRGFGLRLRGYLDLREGRLQGWLAKGRHGPRLLERLDGRSLVLFEHQRRLVRRQGLGLAEVLLKSFGRGQRGFD